MQLQALEVPPLEGRVNDYAGMLSQPVRSAIERELAAFEAAESTQLVVLTLPSLEGEAIESFSLRVVESWKIGQEGRDNGALLLVARDDRKVRIEVGYGLEGSLTDLVAGRIVQNEVVPLFRAGRFEEGIGRGVLSMMDAVRGEYEAAPLKRRGGKDGPVSVPLLMLLLFLLYFFGRFSGGHRVHGGGYYGGFPGGFGGGGSFGGGGFGGGGFGGGGGGFGGGGASGSW